MGGSRLQLRILARAKGLPAVVEGVILVVPVHRPVVNVVGELLDLLAHFVWYVLRIGDDEVLEPHGRFPTADFVLQLQVVQVEEAHLFFGRVGHFQRVARDGDQAHLDAVIVPHLAHQIVQAHLEIPAEEVHLTDAGRLRLFQGLADLPHGDGAVHAAYVHVAAGFLPVQGHKAGDRLGAVELEDEVHIAFPVAVGGKFVALVVAEVEDLKRLAALDLQQPLARDLDRPL